MVARWIVVAVACSTAACGGSALNAGGGGDGGSNEGGGGDSGPAPDSGIRTPATTGKLDVLFMIDNSASMGDKQNYLAAAIPDFIGRLVQPNCVDPNNPQNVEGRSDPGGGCAMGQLEFAPVHDMHIGVISSSLGPRGGDLCTPSVGLYQDDDARLLSRGATSNAPDLTASNFLAWFPNVPSNAGKDAGASPTIAMAPQLETDFADLVAGVQQTGCGIESQLESWYRFLVQPDPYASIAKTNGTASWVGVDSTILAQRHDFLRPDSAVVIVDLSDENDSEIDVRALGQQGYNWLVSDFTPPRGWAVCLTNPADPSCTSCAIDASDPNCAMGPYVDDNDWGFNANLRHVHMKSKYGLDVQFPITRYVNGLTSPRVPDRTGEYPVNGSGQTSTSYVGTNDCTNPLFAGALPDGTSTDASTLCNLPAGSRAPGLVFYAHIGGVPYQLLHYVPNDPTMDALTAGDWVKILGNDPDSFDYTGIDPHMIESYQPRAGLPDPTSADDADPESGREWITDSNPLLNGTSVDLEFACTFSLTQPRDCTELSNSSSCDCPTSGTWEHEYTPPLCGDGVATPQTTQIAGKAYPTIREIELVKLMGQNGVLASICPIHISDNSQGDDPFYGYRPAVTALVDRLRVVLTN